jgi:glycosyltransferase involved in cell wall biosynthesis
MDQPLRHVLLITYHFPPSAGVAVHRMLGLVRHLPDFGWRPVVVAPPRLRWEPQDQALLQQVPDGTPVYHVPFRARGLWSRLGDKFAPLLRWQPDARHACLEAVASHRPEAVITSSPPGCVHYLGRAMQKRFGLPWIICLRDPWIANFRPDVPRSWTQWLETPMEARVMRQADAIVANTPLNLKGLQAAYPAQAHKMEYILNGFDPERFEDLPTWQPAADRITLLHAGELYSGRDPRPLLDALKNLHSAGGRARWRVEFLGESTEGTFDLPREVASRALSDVVQLTPQVPYAEALGRLGRADILLLLHTPGMKIGVPAKLYEYLGARRPILALAEPDSDIAWVLKDTGTPHRIAPFRDVPRIQQALVELAGEVHAGVTVPAGDERLEPFTRRAMARRFAQRLDALTASRPHTGDTFYGRGAAPVKGAATM